MTFTQCFLRTTTYACAPARTPDCVLKTKYQHLNSGKLEFLALKWSITEQFRDYPYYSPKFTVFTNNNPLIYILTTAKLNATGLRWVGELSDFNFDIKYRPGRSSTDADSLSRLPGYFEEYMASCTQAISQKELDTSITIWLTSFTTDKNMLGDDGAFFLNVFFYLALPTRAGSFLPMPVVVRSE